jgi:hypothetical protein
MPDPDSCQCNSLNIIVYFSLFYSLAYYTCKEEGVARVHCPDKHLFDEDVRICNDYRKVFCGNRPTNERGNDPCKLVFFIFIKR